MDLERFEEVATLIGNLVDGWMDGQGLERVRLEIDEIVEMDIVLKAYHIFDIVSEEDKMEARSSGMVLTPDGKVKMDTRLGVQLRRTPEGNLKVDVGVEGDNITCSAMSRWSGAQV